MEKGENNYPFFHWMPKPLGITLLILMFIPWMFAGGTYLTNVAEMVGTTGLWMEDYQLISSCSFLGMSLFFPFMVRYLQTRNVRKIYICGILLLILINTLLAHTESVTGQCALCIVLGFVRVMLVLNTTFVLAPYAVGLDTLAMFTAKEMPDPKDQYAMDHQRALLMSGLYLLIMVLIQLSNYMVGWIAYEYQWNYSYTLVNIILGCFLLFVWITMDPVKRNDEHYKIPWQMTGEVLLMACFLCATCHVLIYGKTLDWFSSPKICIGTIVALVSLGMFICLEICKKGNTYLDLHVFLRRNVWIGIALFLITVLANYGNTLMVSYIKMASSASNLHGAALSLWNILGCVSGYLLGVIMILRKVRYKYIFGTELLLMCFSNIYLYFQYQPQGLYDNMILPSVINYAGMFMPYAVVCAYGMNRLPAWMLPSWLFLMIAVRNVLAPAASMSIYSTLMQERKQYYITRFAQDTPDLSDAAKVNGSAALVGMKETTGDIIWFSGICATLVLACPNKWSLKS